MNQNLIFIPVLAHMLLVFTLFIQLGIAKSSAVKLGEVNRKDAALNPKAWPESVVKISNNIGNQFETPVLFYMLAIMIFLTNNINSVVLILMSIYTATRYLHSYFHITKNFVPNRFKAFLVGVLILLGLTVWQFALLIISI
tara:strand:+ start:17281 stop:17703 length:423 start_codon:yes stop_codon:yes gene_type:complete